MMACESCKAKYKAAKVYETWLLSSHEEQFFNLTGHLPDCQHAPKNVKTETSSQAGCACRAVDGVQVTWCAKHNGWEYGRQMDALRQKAEAKLADLSRI